MKLGAEFEYWVTDEKGRLQTAETLSNRFEFAEQEFVKPLYEVKTNPQETVEELKEEAKHNVLESIEVAEDLGLRLVPLGTPLNSGEIEAVGSLRGKMQKKIVGEPIEYAKRVAGIHFHFEQENAAEQANILTALDPAIALSTSSRYCKGSPIANNARNQVYRHRCYREFPRHGQLWNYAGSVEEWESKLEKRFREFRKKALEKDVNREKFEEHFSPGDTVWTPVRMRDKFGTVEWRTPDSMVMSRAIELLEQVKDLLENPPELPSFDRVKRTSAKAIRDGVANQDVRKYLEELDMDVSNSPAPQAKIDGTLSRSKARKIRTAKAKKLRKDIQDI